MAIANTSKTPKPAGTRPAARAPEHDAPEQHKGDQERNVLDVDELVVTHAA
jgi:hypothetical protein